MTCNPLTTTCPAPLFSPLETSVETSLATPAQSLVAPLRIAMPAWLQNGSVDILGVLNMRMPPSVVSTPRALATPVTTAAAIAPASCPGVRLGTRTHIWRSGNIGAEILGFNPTSAASICQMQAALRLPQTGTMNLGTIRALNTLVRAVQTDLVSRSHCDVGNIDGIIGPLTAAAMRTHLAGRTLLSFAAEGSCR